MRFNLGAQIDVYSFLIDRSNFFRSYLLYFLL